MTPESAVVAACRQTLAAWRIWHYRNNTGGMKGSHKGKGWFVRFGVPGAADIIGILSGGRFLAVECKAGKGRQSPEQEMFQRAVEEAGGVYWLVWSADELNERLELLAKEQTR